MSRYHLEEVVGGDEIGIALLRPWSAREVEATLEALATQLYALMGCRGVARVDFIVTADGAPSVLIGRQVSVTGL